MNYLIKNFSVLSIGALLSNFIKYLCIVYIIRILSLEDYGKISFALTIMSYLLLLVDFGFNFIGVREIARKTDDAGSYLTDIVFIKIVLSFIAFVISIIIVLTFTIPSDTKYLIVFYSFMLFLSVFNLDWFFQSFEKMNLIAICRISRSAATLILTLILVQNHSNLILVPAAEVLALTAVILLNIYLLKPDFLKVKFIINQERVVFLLKEAFPVFLTLSLVTVYNNIDILFLNYYRDEKTVGIYSAIYKIVTLGVLPIVLWVGTIMPQLSKNPFDKKWYFKFFKMNLLIGLICSLSIFFFSRQILFVLYGEKLLHTSSILKIMSAIPIMAAFAGSFTNAMTPYGMQKLHLFATAMGALMNIALNFFFIPEYGMTGAAVSTICAEFTVGLFGCYFLMRRRKHWI